MKLFTAAITALAVAMTANAYVTPKAKPVTLSKVKGRVLDNVNSEKTTIELGTHSIPVTTGKTPFIFTEDIKPCADCLLTLFKADLHHANGTRAGHSNGLVLNHIIATNAKRADTSCATKKQRVFGSGNERATIDLTNSGSILQGYEFKADDTLTLEVGIANTNPTAADVKVTVQIEYVLKSSTTAYSVLTPLWLDLGGECAASSKVPIQPGTEQSTLQSTAWSYPPLSVTADSDNLKQQQQGPAAVLLRRLVAQLDPPLLGSSQTVFAAGGHLTDGGVSMSHAKNGQVVCTSTAQYGGSPEFEEDGGLKHLSGLSACVGSLGTTAPGDKWSISADFNFKEHAPPGGIQSPAPAVGVSIIYLASPVNGTVGVAF